MAKESQSTFTRFLRKKKNLRKNSVLQKWVKMRSEEVTIRVFAYILKGVTSKEHTMRSGCQYGEKAENCTFLDRKVPSSRCNFGKANRHPQALKYMYCTAEGGRKKKRSRPKKTGPKKMFVPLKNLNSSIPDQYYRGVCEVKVGKEIIAFGRSWYRTWIM